MISDTPEEGTSSTAWWWYALPVLVALVLRLNHIEGPEAFVDEGANILTSLDPRVREAFDPLAQGRPWLVHLFAPTKWLPAHALSVARVMSALAGIVTMLLVGWTLHQLAGRRASMVGLWLWAVLPFAVFYERFALQDPFITTLLAGAVGLVTAASRAQRDRERALCCVAAGAAFGSAFLLKISAILALPWLGLLYLGLQFHSRRPVFAHGLLMVGIGAVVPVSSLGPALLKLGSHLDRYSALPPLTGTGLLLSAGERLVVWLRYYFDFGGWPLVLLVGGGIFLCPRTRDGLAWICLLGWGTSLFVDSVFFNNTYGRYALPEHLPLIYFLGLAWGSTASGFRQIMTGATTVLALALVRWSIVSWQIGANPEQAPVSTSEIDVYYQGMWSGSGLDRVRRFLSDYSTASNLPCMVITHQFHRPGCYGLMLMELGDSRIAVLPQTVHSREYLGAIAERIQMVANGKAFTAFLLHEGRLHPVPPWFVEADSPVRLVFHTAHGAEDHFTLWQLDLERVLGRRPPPAANSTAVGPRCE